MKILQRSVLHVWNDVSTGFFSNGLHLQILFNELKKNPKRNIKVQNIALKFENCIFFTRLCKGLQTFMANKRKASICVHYIREECEYREKEITLTPILKLVINTVKLVGTRIRNGKIASLLECEYKYLRG